MTTGGLASAGTGAAPRAVVVGGTGYIGTRTTRALLDRGWSVTTFATRAAGRQPDGSRFVQGDRNDPSALRSLARMGDVDVVIDLVAYTAADTRSMADAWAGRTRLFVHLSTVAVYRRLLAPVADEDHTERWSPQHTGYGADKAASERELESRVDVSSIILRPAPIMGPDDPVSRENYVAKRLLVGRRLLHPGSPAGHVHLLYIDDLVQALLRAVVQRPTGSRAYTLVQSEPLTLRQHVEAIGLLVGRPDAYVHELPLEALADQHMRLCGFPFGLPSPQRLSGVRAIAELGFTPTPYEQALDDTISQLMPIPHSRPAWPGRQSMQSRLCGTHEWLHADQERFLSTAVPAPRLRGPEEPLNWLTGRSAGDTAVLPAAQWDRDAQIPNGPSSDGEPPQMALVIPDAMLTALTPPSDQAHRNLGAPDLSPLTDHSRALRLAAVMEWNAERSPHSAWLYTQAATAQSLTYGPSAHVLSVQLTPYAELDYTRLEAEDYALVTINTRADAERFIQFLEHCEARGTLQIPSLTALARVFLCQVCRWMGGHRASCSPGGRRSFCPCSERAAREEDPTGCTALPAFLVSMQQALRARSPQAELWAGVFDIARLMLRSGAAPAMEPQLLLLSTRHNCLIPGVPVDSGQDRGGSFRLRTGIQLCRLGERSYAADVVGDRLIQLSPQVLAVAEVVERISRQGDAIRVLAEVLGVGSTRAQQTLNDGLRVLQGAELVESRDPFGGTATDEP